MLQCSIKKNDLTIYHMYFGGLFSRRPNNTLLQKRDKTHQYSQHILIENLQIWATPKINAQQCLDNHNRNLNQCLSYSFLMSFFSAG